MSAHRVPNPQSRSRKNSAGFTLTELLVAMGLGLIILGVVGYAFFNTNRAIQRTSARVRLHQQAAAIFQRIEAQVASSTGVLYNGAGTAVGKQPDNTIVSYQGSEIAMMVIRPTSANDSTHYTPVGVKWEFVQPVVNPLTKRLADPKVIYPVHPDYSSLSTWEKGFFRDGSTPEYWLRLHEEEFTNSDLFTTPAMQFPTFETNPTPAPSTPFEGPSPLALERVERDGAEPFFRVSTDGKHLIMRFKLRSSKSDEAVVQSFEHYIPVP